MVTTAALKAYCKSLGLTEVGVADHIPRPEKEDPLCPLAAGKGPERYELTTVLPGCRSALVILFPYKLPDIAGSNLSLYCQIPDYHPVVRGYLAKIADWIQAHAPFSHTACLVDTSPLAERLLAVQAGVGILGDNGCVINTTYGSYCFIGAVLMDFPLEVSSPAKGVCLHCGRCAKACLGQCFSTEGYAYPLCKSYLTQKKGELTPEEKNVMGKSPTIFGCDVCQTVCPLNRDAKNTPLPEFWKSRMKRLSIEDLDSLSNREFRKKYGNYAFSWRGKQILLRNLSLAGHSKNT